MGGTFARTDLSGGRGWLRTDAAESIARIDAALGRLLDINSAGRTPTEQQEMVDRMHAGGPFALPVGTSPHEAGTAVDSDDLAHDEHVDLLADHGWIRDALHRGEWWHAVYSPERDRHKHEGTPMNAEQEHKLDKLAQDVGWLKDRIGGSYKGSPLTTLIGKIIDDIGWLKTRIGGSWKGPTVAAELDDIQDDGK